jgi:hypothetical protein
VGKSQTSILINASGTYPNRRALRIKALWLLLYLPSASTMTMLTLLPIRVFEETVIFPLNG